VSSERGFQDATIYDVMAEEAFKKLDGTLAKSFFSAEGK
jgi:hypothetical protein